MQKQELTLIQFQKIAQDYTQFIFQLSQQAGFDPCSGARVRQVFDEVVVYSVVPERIIFAADAGYLQLNHPRQIIWSKGAAHDTFAFRMKEQVIKILAIRP